MEDKSAPSGYDHTVIETRIDELFQWFGMYRIFIIVENKKHHVSQN